MNRFSLRVDHTITVEYFIIIFFEILLPTLETYDIKDEVRLSIDFSVKSRKK
jgi:hypothetical protein